MVDWSNFKGFFATGIPSGLLYSSLVAAAATIIVGLFLSSIKRKLRYVLWVLLIEYLFVVVCSTVICRSVQDFSFARLELVPFWTYRAVLNQAPGVSVWDIVLNVEMFLPLGLLVKLLFPKLPLGKVLLIAVAFSLCIETSQYLLEKGIAQIDDVMHNAIGAGGGWGVASALLVLTKRDATRSVLC